MTPVDGWEQVRNKFWIRLQNPKLNVQVINIQYDLIMIKNDTR